MNLEEMRLKYIEATEKYEKENPLAIVIYFVPEYTIVDSYSRIDDAHKISIDEARQILSKRPIQGLSSFELAGVLYIEIVFDECNSMYIPVYLIQKGVFAFWYI